MAQQATEFLDFESAAKRLPENQYWIEQLIPRLKAVANIPDSAKVLDLGAAQGQIVIALEKMGYQAFGIEPISKAREIAQELAKREGTNPAAVVEGMAEKIPFSDESFHLVTASQLMEHAADPYAVCLEANRILVPGGIFVFTIQNRLHPRSHEIAWFPFFNWYPTLLRHKIMFWAVENYPALVGHTKTPGVHAFTPWGIRKMLREIGFAEVYDRWDLQRPEERKGWQLMALRAIKFHPLMKLAADILILGGTFAGIKA
jgi:2-polyprenyl-6-hydroxyphenyl methylase/3-demethylubiquinone-9 3-methyltransferase